MDDSDQKTGTNVKKPDRIIIPRRAPSVEKPQRKIVFITPDKIVCAECTCFPKEDPYVRPKKLYACQQTPATLYELSAKVLDRLPLPEAFAWSVDEAADWMAYDVGLPEYKDCIIINNINGLRLLVLEDPSRLPEVNIHDFQHIKIITASIRKLFRVDFIRFCRSIGLPPRKPLTHCTWFKSRTGPTWGIRQNWTRSDLLRAMQIIGPEPFEINHWDLVWYKSNADTVKFARIPDAVTEPIPIYKKTKPTVRRYLVPRRFRIIPDLSESKQVIWITEPIVPKVKKPVPKPRESRLAPKTISLTGLSGDEYLLAKRRLPRPKFLP